MERKRNINIKRGESANIYFKSCFFKNFVVTILIFLLLFNCIIFSGCKEISKEKVDTNLEITLKNDEIKGKICYDVENLKGDKLFFALYPNNKYFLKRDENNNFNSIDYINIEDKNSDDKIEKNKNSLITEILNVKVNLQSIPFDYVKDNCYLAVKVKNSKNNKVEIEFVSKIKKNKNYFGKIGDIINCSYFYPILVTEKNEDQLPVFMGFGNSINCHLTNMKVAVKIPSTYVIACGLNCENVENNFENTTYFYSIKNCGIFSFSVSENFKVYKHKWGNSTINCYFKDDFNIEKAVEILNLSLDFLKDNVGDFPFSCLSLCFENIKGVSLSTTAFSIVETSDFSENLAMNIAYSLISQYFGNCTFLNSYKNPYFFYGLNNLITCIFMGKTYGKAVEDVLIRFYKSSVNTYIKGDNTILDKNIVPLNKELNKYQNFAEYSNIAGKLSTLFFNYLKNSVKEKNFFKTLKKLYKNKNFCYFTCDDYINCFKGKKNKVKKYFEDIVKKGEIVCLQ